MKNILITGGAGSVGKELALNLFERGYKISVFDIPQADFIGLEEVKEIELVKGDITDSNSVEKAVKEMDIVVHLAALLPPVSEMNESKTRAVNVVGTQNLVDGIKKNGNKSRLVFSSTVATYGDTTSATPPITVDHPQNPNTFYSKTKVEAEGYILASDINFTILRVTGVVIPALMDPPEWPFTADQRVEFINRADVSKALLASVESNQVFGKVLNISGGKTWQMKGHEFVAELFRILDIPVEDAEYQETPIYSDWYDTDESQQLLKYQETTFPKFLESLEKAIEEVLG